VRYVLPQGPAQAYARALAAKKVEPHTSGFNSYERRYAGQPLAGRRLAIYRHAAFGDQLMVTSVACHLATQHPAAAIDVYCSPGVLDLWRGLPVRALPAPLTFDAARAYDYHLLYDGMCEMDREPEQANAYDNLFGFAGLPDVAPEWKRPRVAVLDTDRDELANYFAVADRDYIVVQLQAANANRTYPPAQLAEFCRRFVREFPELHIVVVGLDRPAGIELAFTEAMRGVPHTNLVGMLPSFRLLFPLVAQARLVVCPDSSVGHLAAAFPRVPCISLWGLFHPSDRARYYANHHPLFVGDVCPHAPCHNHDFALPQERCREAANATPGVQAWCNALRAIEPDDILRMAREILA
jgi:ADP-heptose:LPS heptosyltransferase